jgi:hypothetical protein
MMENARRDSGNIGGIRGQKICPNFLSGIGETRRGRIRASRPRVFLSAKILDIFSRLFVPLCDQSGLKQAGFGDPALHQSVGKGLG